MSRFIAAMDQSGGSTPGALDRYGIEYTEISMMDKIHEMRMRMINAPAFNANNISDAILFKDSVDRGVVQILKEKGINAFLKIDNGCEPNGYMKYFKWDKMASFAINSGCIGTKMRSVVTSINMIDMILEQQFALAKTICAAGLIPIIEPEVPIDHPDKENIEKILDLKLFECIATIPNDHKIILKLTPPNTHNLYSTVMSFDSVHKLVFLSGGYDLNQACNKLGLNDGVVASFSRALSEGLNHSLTDDEFNSIIEHNINMIAEASE